MMILLNDLNVTDYSEVRLIKKKCIWSVNKKCRWYVQRVGDGLRIITLVVTAGMMRSWNEGVNNGETCGVSEGDDICFRG